MSHYVPTLHILVLASLQGCMNGPMFLQQSTASNRSASDDSVDVETSDDDGVATGSISSESKLTQVIRASNNSSISGASVSFPPGSLAIDTEVSIESGETVATSITLDELGLGVSIAAFAPSVAISSTVALDASQAFTVALPLPDSSKLHLTDPEANIVVFYKVKKIGSNGFFTGVISGDLVQVKNGFARVTAYHFGVFQVAFLSEKISISIEVAATDPVPEPKPIVAAPVKQVTTYYVRGFQSLSFDANTAAQGGLKAWIPTVNPTKVGVGSSLTKDLIGRVFKGE